MSRRILAVSLVTLGLLIAVGAVASATFLRPSQTVTAVGTATGVGTYLVTAPATLDDIADDVQITASAQGSTVVAVSGQYRDVVAWIGDDPADLITGVETWEELRLVPLAEIDLPANGTQPTPDPLAAPDATPTAEQTPVTDQSQSPDPSATPQGDDELLPGETSPDAAAVDPRGSDMWLNEAGSPDALDITWHPASDNEVLFMAAVGADGEPLSVSYTWDRSVDTPLVLPGLILAFMLILMGISLELWHRRDVVRTAKAEAAEELVALTTGGIPVITPEILAGTSPVTEEALNSGRIMTRRELRELREQLEREKLGKSERPDEGATGSIPSVTSAPEPEQVKPEEDVDLGDDIEDYLAAPQWPVLNSAPSPAPNSGLSPDSAPEAPEAPVEPSSPALATADEPPIIPPVQPSVSPPLPPASSPTEVSPAAAPDADASRDPRGDAWRQAWGFAVSAPEAAPSPVDSADDFDDAESQPSSRHRKFFRHRRKGE